MGAGLGLGGAVHYPWKVWKQGEHGPAEEVPPSRKAAEKGESRWRNQLETEGSLWAVSGYDERICLIPRAGPVQGEHPSGDTVKGSKPTLLRELSTKPQGPVAAVTRTRICIYCALFWT